MVSPIIDVKHLDYRYPQQATDQLTLHDISFTVMPGEWVAIVGHNGSGKSTLAKNLNGLLAPAAGTITVDGQVLSEETVWDIRRKIGMVSKTQITNSLGQPLPMMLRLALKTRACRVPRC